NQINVIYGYMVILALLSFLLIPYFPLLSATPYPSTPYPHGFKCFTCEKASDNYECNRWAPDVYCPRGNQPHPNPREPLYSQKCGIWHSGVHPSSFSVSLQWMRLRTRSYSIFLWLSWGIQSGWCCFPKIPDWFGWEGTLKLIPFPGHGHLPPSQGLLGWRSGSGFPKGFAGIPSNSGGNK
uniref:Uncharacterized protein n=1 Tax=Zonotrichia albicollis TaxID=44394 RepID=A0A8D2M2B6_ZONAL